MKKFFNKENFNHEAMDVFKKRNTMRNILITFGLLLVLASCEDFFEPKLTNERTIDQVMEDPGIVRGLLTYAYRAIPTAYDTYGNDFLDCATDNALANNLTGNMNKMISIDGYWTAESNPLNNWSARYDDLKNVNQFIAIGLDGTVVYFKADQERDEAYRNRLKGEAYFLRAWIHFDMLQNYAGYDENGQLMGIPLITAPLDITGELNLTRNTFADCVQQIIDDLDVALAAGLPDAYNAANEDFGPTQIGRPTTVACKALKSRLLLYAASPAFQTGTYADAADAAMDVIDMIGTSLPNVYNVNTISASFYNNDTNDELIMRRLSGNQTGDNGLEQDQFPPTHYGNGKCNPSQNLVDAFPMANGYPISDVANSGYSESNMYVGRDPRFYMTVIYNNMVFKGQTIETFEGGNNMPGAPGVTVENSTRTGYYLRKWISDKANLVSGNTVNDYHYNALFRKVEIFLNFAEAANEAVGPDVAIGGMTARQAIAEVRRRAGIAAGGSDDYLASITTKEQMRDLIKNERRIELCFEGHRFFDLRRWKDNLNETVKGITITNNGGSFSYSRKDIVTPSYKPHMYYGPLPKNEILKTGLTQNQGW